MSTTQCGFNTVPGGSSGSELLTYYGPTLLVNIGFDAKHKPTSKTAPIAGITGVNALVDMGATECAIDNILAAQLNLPIVDRRKVAGSNGSHEVNVYLAQIYIPSLNHTMYGAFAGVELKAGGQMHSALIGRTFLQNFTMTYEGKTGTVTLSN